MLFIFSRFYFFCPFSAYYYDIVKRFLAHFSLRIQIESKRYRNSPKINQAFGNDSVNERTVH